MDLRKYQQARMEIDKLHREAAQAEGGLKQILKRFREEFQVHDVVTATKLLRERRAEKVKLQAQLDRMLEKYQTEFSELMENNHET